MSHVIPKLYPNCIRNQRRECLDDLESLVTLTRYSYICEVLEDLHSIPGSTRYISPPFDLLRNPPGLLSSVFLRYSGSSVEETNHVYEAGCLGREQDFFLFRPITSAVVFRLRGISIFMLSTLFCV